MPSVDMRFLSEVLAVLERTLGKRAANQEQINALIEAAGELERAFLACPLVPTPTSDQPGSKVCEICGGSGVADNGHLGQSECYNCEGMGEYHSVE